MSSRKLSDPSLSHSASWFATIGETRDVVEDDEALVSQPLDEHFPVATRSLRRRVPGRNGRGSTLHEAGTRIEMRPYGIRDLAGGVVEKDVDAVRANYSQPFCVQIRPVVEGGVISKLGDAPRRFRGRAGEADDVAFEPASDLADDTADGAGGGRNKHRLSRRGPADFSQCQIRRDPRDAEHAERGAEWAVSRIDGTQHLRVGGHAVVLPAEPSIEMIADGDPRMPRLLDDAHGQRTHHAADRDGIRVVGARVDPAALCGVDGEIEISDQELTVDG